MFRTIIQFVTFKFTLYEKIYILIYDDTENRACKVISHYKKSGIKFIYLEISKSLVLNMISLTSTIASSLLNEEINIKNYFVRNVQPILLAVNPNSFFDFVRHTGSTLYT